MTGNLVAAATITAPSLPGVLAVPAGTPWPVAVGLGIAGLITGLVLAVLQHSERRQQEKHLHREMQIALKIALKNPLNAESAAIVAVLRSGSTTQPSPT